jgi:polar amino acid transport system ATP-binding protein
MSLAAQDIRTPPPHERSILSVQALAKAFGPHTVLEDINLEVGRGDVISVIGPSGSGKSTLLRCLALLEKPSKGTISLEDQTIADSTGRSIRLPASARAQIGMVFQSFNLWPHLTVLGNIIEAPTRVRKLSKTQATELACSLLERVGLLHKRDEYPTKLSGGQQQRVAIARALAMAPKIMLFDEATSALDPELTHEVLEVIRDLAQEGMTMMLVTHEMQFARRLSTRLVFMDAGKILEDRPPADFFDAPQTDRARRFLEKFHVF